MAELEALLRRSSVSVSQLQCPYDTHLGVRIKAKTEKKSTTKAAYPAFAERARLSQLPRCDGIQPVCGNCARVPKAERCTFTDPESKKAIPEAPYIPNDSEGFVGTSTTPWFNLADFPGYRSPGVEFSPFTSSSSSDVPSANPDFRQGEPPLETIQLLLQYFLPHADQFGFFLHIDRFRSAVLLPAIPSPFSELIRPAQSLLYAVYLWGAHLSQADEPGSLFDNMKPLFLRRALQCISTEVCEQRDTMHVVQTIQAHVLLANYFLVHRKFLPAHLHASGAATLALGYRLHKLGSASAAASVLAPDGINMASDVYLRPPQDALEAGEWIRGFWTVVGLQTTVHLVAPRMAGGTGLKGILEVAEGEINTPWPMRMLEYEMQLGQCQFPVPVDTVTSAYGPATDASVGSGSDVVQRFMTDECTFTVDSVTNYSKATVLLHHASLLGAKWSSTLQPPTEFATYMTAYTQLERRISLFRDTLPPVYPRAEGALVLAHSLASIALLTLHRAFPFAYAADPSPCRCVAAARAVLQALGTGTASPGVLALAPAAQPAFGAICALACSTLVDKIVATRTRAQLLGAAATSAEDQDEHVLGLHLREGIRILGSYAAARSPLAEHQLWEIQQQYNVLYGSL
ncbi:hypothetical protein GGX14DRAFT_696204 [Mycena pura]|uniref:Transcription factor domain-containing protein n=1 Tax=Mycena pura TaxID=153505 RepID=A0AAD6VMC8_9AGAR|nr:hypothetical protein GGX14DRAFT_696204 [Mycena pura]